jgi:hypothetical protein
MSKVAEMVFINSEQSVFIFCSIEALHIDLTSRSFES